jgi:hemoglobin
LPLQAVALEAQHRWQQGSFPTQFAEQASASDWANVAHSIHAHLEWRRKTCCSDGCNVEEIVTGLATTTTTRANDTDSLFEQIGGRRMLEAVHRKFYDKVYEHPWLSQFFGSIEQEVIERQQTDFMSFAMGGPPVYCGRMVPRVHEHMMITDELFALRSEMLAASIDEAGLAAELCAKWLKIDSAFQHAIVKSKRSDCVPRYAGDQILDFPRPAGM